MKTNILISSVLFTAFLLTACGGGSGAGKGTATTKAGMCDAIAAIQAKAVPEAGKKDAMKVMVTECMKGSDAEVKTVYDNVQMLPK